MSDTMSLVEEHTKDAEMEIKRDHLVDDEPDGKMLVEELESDEQIKYLYSHNSKGLRIDKPGEEAETPYNSYSEGERYFIITDDRVLFIAKQEPESEQYEIPYSDIGDIETNKGITKSRITIFRKDGTEISFWNQDSDYFSNFENHSIEDYVNEKLQESDTEKGPFCIDCGVELEGDEKFCSECGHDLSSSACQNCSQYLSGIENYCPSCGEEVVES